jgi:hypothetical protein
MSPSTTHANLVRRESMSGGLPPSTGVGSTGWLRTSMDCQHDPFAELRTVHLKPEAPGTIGAQPPEPCSRRGRPKVCLQLQPALRRVDSRNHRHGMLTFFGSDVRQIGRWQIGECDPQSALTTQFEASHRQRSGVPGVNRENCHLPLRVPTVLSRQRNRPRPKPQRAVRGGWAACG